MRTASATTVGRMRLRVWASPNADGTSARELTSSVQVGGIVTMNVTTSTFTSTITWAAPAVNLSNEYLFFQPEWEETTAGTSTVSAQYYQSAGTVTTTNFTVGYSVLATPAGSYALTGTTAGLYIPSTC
jgi:hypothetical protein